MLSLPMVYSTCMNMLGGQRAESELIFRYIRPAPGMRILDLGCGPAAILKLLPEKVVYVGIDISQAYVDAARKRYGDRAVFHCMPVESVSSANLAAFDLVIGLGVLHHLDDAQAEDFFSLAAQVLHDKGRCLTLDPCLVDGQHWITRRLIELDRGRNIRNTEGYQALAAQSFSQAKLAIRHDLLRVPYTHLIMECRKS